MADDVSIKIGAKIDDVEAKVGKVLDELRKLQKAAKDSENAGGEWKELAGELGLVMGKAELAREAIGLLKDALRFGIEQSMEFEAAISHLGTVLEGGQESADRLGRKLNDMTRESKLGIQPMEAIAAASHAASSGFEDAAAAANITKAALVGAKAMSTDVKSSVDVLTTILEAYQMGTGDAARVTDMLVASMKAGKAEGPALAHNLGQVIAVAAQAEVPLEQLLGAIAKLSKTMPTSEAISSLNMAIAGLLAPTDQAQKNLDKLGLSSEELRAVLKQDGLPAALEMVQKAAGGNESTLRQLVGDMNAVKAVFTLTGKNAQDFAAIVEQVGNSSGEAMKTAQQEADNLKTVWEDLHSAAAALASESGMEDWFRGIAEGMRDAADAAREFKNSNQDTTSGIAGILDMLNPADFSARIGGLNTALQDLAWGLVSDALKTATKDQQEFFQKYRAGLELVGKSSEQLVDMGATGDRFAQASLMLDKLAEIARAKGDEATAARLEQQKTYLASVRQEVELEIAERKRAADATKKADDEAATAARVAESQKAQAIRREVEELKAHRKGAAFETAAAELAAIDAVLAKIDKSSEDYKTLAADRKNVAKEAADEETAAAVRAIEHRTTLEQLSTTQQIALIEEVLAAHTGSLKERQRLEDQLVQLRGKAAEESADAEKKAAEKALDARLNAIAVERAKISAKRDLTIDDEERLQRKVVAIYKKGTDERAKAELDLLALQERRRKADEAAAERIRDIQGELADAKVAEVDDEIRAAEEAKAAAEEAGQSTVEFETKILELKKQRVALEQAIAAAEMQARIDAEKDPRVKAELEKLAAAKRADSQRDAAADIKAAEAERTRALKEQTGELNKQLTAAQGVAAATRDAAAAAGSWPNTSTSPNFESGLGTPSVGFGQKDGWSINSGGGSSKGAGSADMLETKEQAIARAEKTKASQNREGIGQVAGWQAAADTSAAAAIASQTQTLVAELRALAGAVKSAAPRGSTPTQRQATNGRAEQEANMKSGGGT